MLRNPDLPHASIASNPLEGINFMDPTTAFVGSALAAIVITSLLVIIASRRSGSRPGPRRPLL